jgi:hypothetical protein
LNNNNKSTTTTTAKSSWNHQSTKITTARPHNHSLYRKKKYRSSFHIGYPLGILGVAAATQQILMYSTFYLWQLQSMSVVQKVHSQEQIDL